MVSQNLFQIFYHLELGITFELGMLLTSESVIKDPFVFYYCRATRRSLSSLFVKKLFISNFDLVSVFLS